MSSNGSYEANFAGAIQEHSHTVVEYVEEESVEPSMSEWASLEDSIVEVNPKREMYDRGLYDPGSGEMCAAYIKQSDSDVLRHVYYNYPSVTDPGISNALFGPPPTTTYPNDGQELYLTLCKEMNQCPVRIFHRALLGTKADLSYYGVNPHGVQAMAKALVKNRTLAVLDLTDNFLNDDACFHLGEMLATNTVLTELNLSGCRIGVSGILKLCAGLPPNRTLRALNLSGNQLGDKGVEHLANAVYSRADVRELDLSNNDISGKSIQMLSEALEWNNKITHLDLSRNNLYSFPSGLSYLLNQLSDSGLLEYLNLSWNSLSGSKASGAIRKVFKSENLKHLDISQNKLYTTEVVIDLTNSMARPKKMITYNVSYNPINAEDALLFIEKLQTKAVKLQVLNMEAISVNIEFTRILKAMKQRSYKRNVVVTHGYVEGTFKPKGPDPRDTILNRAEYICKKPKKNKVDIALVVYQLLKYGNQTLEVKEFGDVLVASGADIDEGLLAELQCVFPGPTSKKGAKKIDIEKMADYIKRKWPERKLPLTPPPEPEPPVTTEEINEDSNGGNKTPAVTPTTSKLKKNAPKTT